MKNAYTKYFAANNARERWFDELQGDLQTIGERYIALVHNLGRQSSDRFPATVTEIEEYRDGIHVSGYWTRRGCTDKETCMLPTALVYGTPEEREQIFENLQREIDDMASKKVKQQEDAERALYDTLKHKFAI